MLFRIMDSFLHGVIVSIFFAIGFYPACWIEIKIPGKRLSKLRIPGSVASSVFCLLVIPKHVTFTPMKGGNNE